MPNGQARNAAKSEEKFFAPYTWATEDQPDRELTAEDLTQMRAQRLKLRKAMNALKASDLRLERGRELIRILDDRISTEAKKRGRFTEKSEAVDETKAQIQVCQDQHHTLGEALGREMERHSKNVAKIWKLCGGSHAELQHAAEGGVQIAEELLLGDPDKELGDPAEEPAPALAAPRPPAAGEEPPAAESKAGTQQSLLSGACLIRLLIRASVLSRHALRSCLRA